MVYGTFVTRRLSRQFRSDQFISELSNLNNKMQTKQHATEKQNSNSNIKKKLLWTIFVVEGFLAGNF